MTGHEESDFTMVSIEINLFKAGRVNIPLLILVYGYDGL